MGMKKFIPAQLSAAWQVRNISSSEELIIWDWCSSAGQAICIDVWIANRWLTMNNDLCVIAASWHLSWPLVNNFPYCDNACVVGGQSVACARRYQRWAARHLEPVDRNLDSPRAHQGLTAFWQTDTRRTDVQRDRYIHTDLITPLRCWFVVLSFSDRHHHLS